MRIINLNHSTIPDSSKAVSGLSWKPEIEMMCDV
jgi:hypothetical protein